MQEFVLTVENPVMENTRNRVSCGAASCLTAGGMVWKHVHASRRAKDIALLLPLYHPDYRIQLFFILHPSSGEVRLS